jgi:adenylate cyclase
MRDNTMAEDGFKRKLTAILSADVKGYSRLMGEDEEATIHTITEYRKIITEQVKQHEGRVVDSPGDNVLAEFASVVNALKCAVQTQKEIAEQNKNLPENRKMEFRIGVNLGDIAEDGDRIYGDGVNVAARIESLAEAGGICISHTAYDQVKKKIALGYEYLGEHSVKNIDEPVRVYRVLTEPEAAGKVIGEKRFLSRYSRRTALAAIIILVIVAGGLVSWNIYLHQSKRIEPASVDKMAHPLPEKPSIAVLAFDNLTGDPSQEYFSDGIAEQIITVLSQVGELFVISRNSSFSYKGKPVKVQQVSEELGVRYVLEGSVRSSGDKVRITAQLIDAIKGQHLWAENYDCDFKDIFEIQDEITMKIVNSLRVKLSHGEQARVLEKKVKNPDVFSKFLQALSLSGHGTKESFVRFGQLAQEILDMAPESPIGYRLLGRYHYHLASRGESPQENFKKAFKFAQKALSMDESDAASHALLGQVYLLIRKYEKAIASGKRSVELQPNGALFHADLGNTLNNAGRVDEAIAHIKQAIRLNPFPPFYYYQHLGLCYRQKGQYEDALMEFKKALQRAPDAPGNHTVIAITYALLDREEEARASAAKALELNPNISVSWISKISKIKDQGHLKLILDAMRKAGFPE